MDWICVFSKDTHSLPPGRQDLLKITELLFFPLPILQDHIHDGLYTFSSILRIAIKTLTIIQWWKRDLSSAWDHPSTSSWYRNEEFARTLRTCCTSSAYVPPTYLRTGSKTSEISILFWLLSSHYDNNFAGLCLLALEILLNRCLWLPKLLLDQI